MRKSSKKIIAIAAGIAAGSAMGILIVPEKKGKYLDKLKKAMDGKCSKEKLEMVKGKMEKHKARLETHIQRINSKLEAMETGS